MIRQGRRIAQSRVMEDVCTMDQKWSSIAVRELPFAIPIMIMFNLLWLVANFVIIINQSVA